MTHQSAKLITPQGKKIELSPDVYKQVKHLLATQGRRPSRTKISATLKATYGKYANGTSLTQALLAEHATERARDDAKLKKLRG